MSLTCLKCGMELKELNGIPCPRCGTPANEGRCTFTADTLRKITKQYVFRAQTVRQIVRLRRQYYKIYPKRYALHLGLFVSGVIAGLNFFGIIGVIVSVAISIILFFLPPLKEKIIEIEVPQSRDPG